MTLRIKYLGHYEMLRGARVEEIEVRGRARIKELLEERLGEALEWEQTIVLANGRPAKPEDEVGDGDTVSVMPFIGGG
jgi:molybdopterin synthase sulfur carrier subunit